MTFQIKLYLRDTRSNLAADISRQFSNWLALRINHLDFQDNPLPINLKKKFYTQTISHYSPVPSNQPCSPEGDDEDDLVSYKNLAKFFLRSSFFKTLFGTSIADFTNQHCFNNRNRGYESIIYSTNYPAGIEATEHFFDTGKGDLETKLFNFVAMKFIDCNEICQLACVMLNGKRIIKPEDPLLPHVLLYGLMVMNLRLSLVKVQNHEYKNSYFTSGNKINLESFEDQYITDKDTYKVIYIIRNIPFVFPSPNRHSNMNAQIKFSDKERFSWKVQPLVNYLGGESRIFMLSRDNLSNSATKCMEPKLKGMSFFCKTFKNVNGTATIETNSMFASEDCFSYHNPNFHHFGKAMVITDRRKGLDRFRTHLKKSLMEVEPIMILEQDFKILTFMEKSLIDDIAPHHMQDNYYIGDISLLPFCPLELPYGTMKSPDSLLPFEKLLRDYM